MPLDGGIPLPGDRILTPSVWAFARRALAFLPFSHVEERG